MAVFIHVLLASLCLVAAVLDMPRLATVFGVIYLATLVCSILPVFRAGDRLRDDADQAWDDQVRRSRRKVAERRARGDGPSPTRGQVPRRRPLRTRLGRLLSGWFDG